MLLFLFHSCDSDRCIPLSFCAWCLPLFYWDNHNWTTIHTNWWFKMSGVEIVYINIIVSSMWIYLLWAVKINKTDGLFSTTKYMSLTSVEGHISIKKISMQWCLNRLYQTITPHTSAYTCYRVQLLQWKKINVAFFFFPKHPWCLSHLPLCYSSEKSAHWSSRSLWGICRAPTSTTSMSAMRWI